MNHFRVINKFYYDYSKIAVSKSFDSFIENLH